MLTVILSRAIGQWSFPGGHLDQGEDFFTCAERETLEETGLKIRALKIVAVTNDVFIKDNKHYISIFTKCERIDPQQQPEVIFEICVGGKMLTSQTLEPNKCEGWEWKYWDEIKDLVRVEETRGAVFLPVVNLVQGNPKIEETISGDGRVAPA